MKMPTLIRKKKKLSAATARRSRSLGLPEMDYEEMAEPNMKLSRALLIVLLLHIVAVAGIVAFNTIKTREAMAPNDPVAAKAEASVAPSPATTAANETPVAPAANNEITQVSSKSETAAEEKPAASPKAVEKKPEIEDSGKIYTVVRGDNPVTIARRFHVNYDALLALNEITDPRKLQIGQKLHLPARSSSSKHKSD